MDKISTLILFITFLSICWYSWETLKLRREAQKQNTTSIRPYLSVQWEVPTAEQKDREKIKEGLVLINSGKGVAVDINIKSLFDCPKESEGFEKSINFYKVPALKLGGFTRSFIDKEKINLLRPLWDGYYTLEVSFLDIENNPYYAIFRVSLAYNDKFEIVEQKAGKYEKNS